MNQTVTNDRRSVHTTPCTNITRVSVSFRKHGTSSPFIDKFESNSFLTVHEITTAMIRILCMLLREWEIIDKPLWVVKRGDRPKKITQRLRIAFQYTPLSKKGIIFSIDANSTAWYNPPRHLLQQPNVAANLWNQTSQQIATSYQTPRRSTYCPVSALAVASA